MSRRHDEEPAAEHMLAVALQECLSPHAVALIAAKLQPHHAKGEEAQQAESECDWFAQRLIELLGQQQYEALCDELGL